MRVLLAEQRASGFATDLPRATRSALQHESVAVLAALFSQLHRRDTVLAQSPNPLSQTAIDTWFAHIGAPALHAVEGTAEECAGFAAGMALRIADKSVTAPTAAPPEHRARPVVVALLRGFPPLASALKLIQQHNLALLLFAGGEADSRAEAHKRLRSTTVPILQVDNADAVALCRVTQECLLRARNGWGGAVIHAASMPGGADPLTLLGQHLQKRGLPLE